MKSIVFISSLSSQKQLLWLENIKAQLPDERVLLPEQISDSQVSNIDIAIVANPDPKILIRFTNLVWIQSLWAGVEKLVSELPNDQIKLVRLIDPQLGKAMAESVLAWTLYLQRNMPEYAKQQTNNQWQQLPSINSKELRVSVLGAGELGIAALTALKKLDYQVNCWSRSPKQLKGVTNYVGYAELTTLLTKTDILINLLPLTPQTHHLLNKALLNELPQGAKLINFSRGAVIDTTALLQLLDNGHIAHAVLDVFEQEPLKETDPIWRNANITVLPHISAQTSMDSAIAIVSHNINEYRNNHIMPTHVDMKLGY